ncbi:asparagine synthase (glutamine-hydrolyzing) [Micromonospora aurantiaca]|uniref:asparagine synthase (glutamine-hydrolyzing) n=1 Tax=Micromonospora aurantiaca (nom. illeg.) TaxID=47850 RepID=UPI0034515738
MCGIAGIARLDGGLLDESTDQLLNGLAEILAHRGPDDTELLRDGPVGLAFTRLSLVDPEGGGQPLSSDDGSLVLIANGEVYNHEELVRSLPGNPRMRTGSDCEVLLHLYREHGLDFLDRVRGMFGLILWDRAKQQLILARDRFGIKPLYYNRDHHRIVLGSEIKALFADPATPRRLNWERALTTPMVSAAPYFTETPMNTWFEGVESVPAATILRIDLRDGSTREHRYWNFPGDDVDAPDTADGFIAAYRDLFAASVAECATADAELGLFLSGGVDSAAVAALAAERVGELHTFTALSASTYLNEDAERAHRVAAKLGLPNHQVVFDPARVPGVAEWKRMLWLLETPLCGPECYYKHELHRYAKAARPELRGMLLGAASDEFNGGYSADLSGDTNWAGLERNLRTMARTTALQNRPGLSPWWMHDGLPLLSDEVVRQYAGRDVSAAYPAYLRWEYQKIQQYNVWHEDRTAAGSGIEARVPFLDHRLVELAAAVPTHLRAELLWDKRMMREAVRGLLPDEIVDRPKVPFYYGSGVRYTYRTFLAMLTQENGSLVQEALAAPEADALIDGAALRESLSRLADDPENPQVEIALHVVNLGLLAGMVADLPAPTIRTPIGQPPPSITISDWAAEQPDIASRIGLRPALDLTAVPRLAAHVLLLTHPDDPGTWYLVADGSIEYVLNGSQPAVLDLLRGIDGQHTLAEILENGRLRLDEVYEQLVELTEQGLVELA